MSTDDHHRDPLADPGGVVTLGHGAADPPVPPSPPPPLAPPSVVDDDGAEATHTVPPDPSPSCSPSGHAAAPAPAPAPAPSRPVTPGCSALDGTPLYLYHSLDSASSAALNLPFSAPVPDPDPAPNTDPDPVLAEPQDPLHLNRSQPQDADHTMRPKRTATPIPAPIANPPPNTHGMIDLDLPAQPSLVDVALCLRQQREQTQKARSAQDQLHRLHVAHARTYRLLQTSRSIQQTLAECIRCEDKHAFSNLFVAFQDATADCSRSSPRLDGQGYPSVANAASPRPACVLDTLSSTSRRAIVDLVIRTGTDTGYIADCLSALSHKELLALLPDRGGARGTDSVFASNSKSSVRSSKPLGFTVSDQLDLISTYSLGSPLETLVAIGRLAAPAGRTQDRHFTRMWAAVCAKLISHQKPGSERLAPALLDLWASTAPWPGKARLESWIAQVLKDGAFLLDRPNKQSFRTRVQGRPHGSSDDEVQAEAFYLQSMESLLDLIADENGPSLLPEGVLEMCHALWTALQDLPGHQRAFPHFVATRWMFTSFLSNAILLPEAHGMLLDQYILDIARHTILREILIRCQKTFLDVAYSWKHGSFVTAENIQRVQAVLACLTPKVMVDEKNADAIDEPASGRANFAVSCREIMTLIDALHPSRRPSSRASELDLRRSGQQSSNSSLSGFALFQVANLEAPPQVTYANLPDSPAEGFLPNDLRQADWQNSRQDKYHDHLREAFSEIEDFHLSRKSDDHAQWVVLLGRQGDGGFETVHERVKQAKSRALTESQHLRGKFLSVDLDEANSGASQPCEGAIEQLLFHHGEVNEARLTGALHLPSDELAHTSIPQLFDEALRIAEESENFVAAHSWHVRRETFEAAFVSSNGSGDLNAALANIQRRAELSNVSCSAVLDLCAGLKNEVDAQNQWCSRRLDQFHTVAEDLRAKMWYTADVRTSAMYDDARSIASALRVMGKTKRASSQARLASPLRSWSNSRLSPSSPHLKAEAQILEVLSAAPAHGGSNKLSDEQSQATQAFMVRYHIDNFCRGEERLHKLCMTIRKCADQLTSSEAADNPVLWASVLFSGDKQRSSWVGQRPATPTLSLIDRAPRRFDFPGLRNDVTANGDAMSTNWHSLSASSSREMMETRSPTLTTRSSGTLWSPALTDQAPSSATSVASYQQLSLGRKALGSELAGRSLYSGISLGKLRQNLLGLLISDVAAGLFDDGSETDFAFWQSTGGELAERHLRSSSELAGSPVTAQEVEGPPRHRFNYEASFERMMHKFSQSTSPAAKMDILLEMQKLIGPYMAQRSKAPAFLDLEQPVVSPRPIANGDNSCSSISDVNIEGFRVLFSDASIRPAAIFRDLQYIASLMPADILENSPQGKAFWNAGIALSGIKNELRQMMVETADSIIAYNTSNRGHGASASAQQQQRDSTAFFSSSPNRAPSAEDLKRYDMSHAAHLLQIAAKEGDAVAQRELATLYLTHPELMDHIVAPFTKPKDVFKDELESKWRKNHDPTRCDPATMCVAHHWMSLSSKAGDPLAKEYLRQREEMERLPMKG